jgi:hypothetical protein
MIKNKDKNRIVKLKIEFTDADVNSEAVGEATSDSDIGTNGGVADDVTGTCCFFLRLL